MLTKETYTLEGCEDFLYSRNSAYIHETKIGIIPSKKDTWDIYREASFSIMQISQRKKELSSNEQTEQETKHRRCSSILIAI